MHGVKMHEIRFSTPELEGFGDVDGDRRRELTRSVLELPNREIGACS